MAPTKSNLSPRYMERELVMGKGVVLTANVTSCDKVTVEGHFKGKIKTDKFVLSEGGHMEGEVQCAHGCIGGNMKGTIVASETLVVGVAGVLSGDVVYDSLQVMDGGRLQGKLTHCNSTAQQEVQEEEKPAENGHAAQEAIHAEQGMELPEAQEAGA